MPNLVSWVRRLRHRQADTFRPCPAYRTRAISVVLRPPATSIRTIRYYLLMAVICSCLPDSVRLVYSPPPPHAELTVAKSDLQNGQGQL